jgi:hypothetical protein
MTHDSTHETHYDAPDPDRRAGTQVAEPVVVTPTNPVTKVERTMSFWSFVAGFVFALVAGAVAILVFFAVSDADDDGNLELDVPAVDVEG